MSVLRLVLIFFVFISALPAQERVTVENPSSHLPLKSSLSLPMGFASDKGVSGGMGAMLGSSLLFTGGCNFPDRSAADGGKKVFYTYIYRGRISTMRDSISWCLVDSLPQARAYAAYCGYRNKLIVAGGENSSGALSSVYAIDSLGKLTDLPPLPEPRTGMGFTRLKNRLYLIGGNVAGKATASVVSLDLDNPSSGWRDEPNLPFAPRLKMTATPTADEQGIALVSSFSLPTDSMSIVADPTYYILDTLSASWTKGRSLPRRMLHRGVSFGGGYAFTIPSIGSFFGGGVNTKRFTPALQRIQDLAKAKEEGDEKSIQRLQSEVKKYLLAPPSYHRFNRSLWSVSPSGLWTSGQGQGGAWSYSFTNYSLSEAPDLSPLSRADACLVSLPIEERGIYDFLIIGGEIKPGIRTNRIGMVRIQLNSNLRSKTK